MKKYLIILVAVITGCQKEELPSKNDLQATSALNANQGQEIRNIDNRLVFKDRKAYDKTIKHLSEIGDENFQNWEIRYNFISMRKFYEDQTDQMPIHDDLLATMLNPEGFIQIGKIVFNIDPETEAVYAFSENIPENIRKIKNRNFDGADIVKFRDSDNVLDFIVNDRINLKAKGAIQGGGNNIASTTIEKQKDSPDKRFNSKNVYQKAGIYFSLQASMTQRLELTGNYMKMSVCITNDSWYKVKGTSTKVMIKDKITLCETKSARKVNVRSYESSNGLSEFFVHAIYDYWEYSGSYGGGWYLTINK
jgi:hypothetical protein